MKEKQKAIDAFKLALFDLHTHRPYPYNSSAWIQKVITIFKQTIHAQHVEISVENMETMSKQTEFSSDENLQYLAKVQENIPDFHRMNTDEIKDITKYMEQDNKGKIYLLKMEKKHTFACSILFTMEKNRHIEGEILSEICRLFTDHIGMYAQRNAEKVEEEQQAYLYQLASKLIGLSRTADVLEVMIESIRKYLPQFTYEIWMLKKIDHDGLPIKQINQTELYHQKFGYEAIFYKKIEMIHHQKEEKTTYAIPFLGSHNVSGLLEVTSPQYLELLPAEYTFFEQFSKLIGQAIERTTLYQSSTQQVENLELINYITRELNSKLERNDIIQIVEEQITNHSYPEQFALFLLNQQTNEIEVALEKDTFFQHLIGSSFMRFIFHHVKQTKRPMFYGDFNGEAHHVPFRSMIAIPLYAENELVGLLMLVHSSRYYFSHDTFKLFQSITQHVAMALMNTYLKEQLKQTIITDYLTQVYSRNYIDTFVMHHMKHGRKGAFILYDIDDFKLINDTYGHYIGDKVLVEVAAIIQKNMDIDGVAARWGGEEFAIYLPNTPLEDALQLANSIRLEISKKLEPHITVSGGVSEWTQKNQHSIESLFIEADEALYRAKSNGKNSISCQGKSMPTQRKNEVK